MEIWTQRLMELFAEKNTTYRDISKATGIPISALHRYISGDTDKVPLDRLEKLANYFEVAIEYLAGWDRAKELQPSPIADQFKTAYDKLTPEKQLLIDQMIQAMLDKP